ncbi:lipase family protein [Adlercreutzia murintestinalis]|uniref:lipase family protein n=1 Tax=Adlercreutzia murintestinalis TaxID=2941325 RepID=UPI00203F0780|nr:lipase family protein [Adlercreutzia murintestinalis]
MPAHHCGEAQVDHTAQASQTPHTSHTAQVNRAAQADPTTREIAFLSPFQRDIGRARHEIETSCMVPWDPAWFAAPHDRFNVRLAATSMAVAAATCRNTSHNDFRYVRGALEALDFRDVSVGSYQHRNEVDQGDYERDVDLVAYGMGHQVINVGGEEVPLVVLAIRGTSRTREWVSNANVADSVSDGNYNVEYHEGFDAAADEAYGHVAQYLVHHGINMSEARVWIVGHSRGAAVANLVAAFLCESGEFSPDHVFAYAFATPGVTRRKDADAAVFGGIFNVIDPVDYVPRLPLESWGFRRFGATYTLPTPCAGDDAPDGFEQASQRLFMQFAGIERPTFATIGPTARLVRHVASISPTITSLYEKERLTKFGRQTFADFYHSFTSMVGDKGGKRAREAAQVSRYAAGPFWRFLSYFAKNSLTGHASAGAHAEEGYLARMLAAVETGLDLSVSAKVRTTAFTAYGDVDLTVKDAAGQTVASIWKGKVEKSQIPAYFDDETDASTVWFAGCALEDYVIELRDRSGYSFGVTIAQQNALGEALEQTEFGPIKIGNGHTLPWNQLAEGAPSTSVQRGGNLHVTVRAEGAKRIDAVGAECLTAGDWAAVYAYEGLGASFKGWYEEGRDPRVAKPLSTHKKYVLRVPHDRALVAVFS